MKNLLRKKSLAKLTSPEQLDRLLVIIRLPGWIALVCLLILIFGVLLWSAFGRIPVTSEGLGIFFDPKSIEVIQTSHEGIIDEIFVKEGEKVEKGERLLLLKDPKMVTKKRELEEEIARLDRKIIFEKKDVEISLEQHHAIRGLQVERLKELEGASNKKEELYALQVEMKREEEIISLLEKELALPEGSLTLLELKKEAADLEKREKELLIRAPVDGSVLVIEVIQGEGVEFGKNLIWFEKDTHRNLVYGFFSIAKGSHVKPGMRAYVQFDTVRTEVYGKMVGTVKEVLFFAGGAKSDILQSIPSQSLREYLSKNEASVIVIVDPIPDSSTPSGYQWTIKEGPPIKIRSGSIGGVEVFIEEKRPINYLIPIGGE